MNLGQENQVRQEDELSTWHELALSKTKNK